MRDAATTRPRTLAQTLALAWGGIFLVAGIAGFIPGITTNLYDGLDFAGNDGDAELIGLFQVSVLHNIVHLLFGVAGILMARTWETARTYLLGSGIIYVVLFLYGLIVGQDSDANFVPMNGWDDVLHIALAAGLLASYLMTSRDRDTVRDRDVTTRPVT